MKQRKTLAICREAGLKLERSSLAIAIKHSQSKHEAVAGLQARLVGITNELLRLEIDNGRALASSHYAEYQQRNLT